MESWKEGGCVKGEHHVKMETEFEVLHLQTRDASNNQKEEEARKDPPCSF
jgi:hypothetical protein